MFGEQQSNLNDGRDKCLEDIKGGYGIATPSYALNDDFWKHDYEFYMIHPCNNNNPSPMIT